MIKIRVPGPKSAHFSRPPARTHWLPTVALLATVGSHGQVQFSCCAGCSSASGPPARSRPASASAARRRAKSMRGCRLVRAPSLRITGTRGHAQLLVSRRLLLLAGLLAAESQLVGFGAAIGRRYDAAARHQCGLLHAAPHGLLASRIGLGFRGHRRVKKKACARARQQHSGVSGECSLPPATGEHCLLAMPLRERVRPVVSGDAKPTEPQSGAMAAAPEGVKSGQISAQGPLF